MTTGYLFDLTKSEFRDDFVGPGSDTGPKEFWQDEARKKLMGHLNDFLKDAIKYSEERKFAKNKTWLSHNAILVSGQRGTGKTVFLRNCEQIWNVDASRMGLSKGDIHFLTSIDPTMLVNEDNFSNVIIAQIYSEVENALKNHVEGIRQANEESKNLFYKKLKVLCDSLGKKDDFNGHVGIDKILSYKSGIHIESHFHEFIEAAINVLKCKALVLPIDDVDMAMHRAFEVVDEVRRLLGCPYIIPIVSGDQGLYHHMVNVHFDEQAYHRTNSSELKEDGKQKASDLTEAYLTKVFPSNMRLVLLPVDAILPGLAIKSDLNDICTYSNLKQLFFRRFYLFCRNAEALKDWPEPESARELAQFIRAFHPNSFKRQLSDVNSVDEQAMWRNLLVWSQQKQAAATFTNVHSFLNLQNSFTKAHFDINDLLAFSPKLQSNQTLYPWGQKPFFEEQKSNLMIVEGSSKTRNNENFGLLESAFNSQQRVLRSMPPLEFIHQGSMVGKAEFEKANHAKPVELLNFCFGDKHSLRLKELGSRLEVDSVNVERLMVSLFTYSNIYSTLKNTVNFVFLSRAFELLFYSFVVWDSETDKNLNNILSLLRRQPFYSIFNMAPTKHIEGEQWNFDADDEKFGDIDGTETSESALSALELTVLISDWREHYRRLFETVNGPELIPLFTYLFNKVFTSFHIFKFSNFMGSTFKDTRSQEHLSDFITRFQYNMVNAACTSMIAGESVQANIAITPNQETLRSKQSFNQFDRTLSRNRARLEEQTPEQDKLNLEFIDALDNHPIFRIIKESSGDDVITPPKVPLGKRESTDNAKVNNSTSKFYSENGNTLPVEVWNKLSVLRKSLESIYGPMNTVTAFKQSILENDKESWQVAYDIYSEYPEILETKLELKKARPEIKLARALFTEYRRDFKA